MPDPKEPQWYMTVSKFVGAMTVVLICFASVWGKADKKDTESKMELKADKKDLDSLALTVSTLASKKEVEGLVSAVSALTKELNELSARQREGVITLKNINDLAEKTDARLVKMQDNQAWQIKQEVDRIQWQSFKPDPPPPANVKQ